MPYGGDLSQYGYPSVYINIDSAPVAPDNVIDGADNVIDGTDEVID